jgi:hypothetical protein
LLCWDYSGNLQLSDNHDFENHTKKRSLTLASSPGSTYGASMSSYSPSKSIFNSPSANTSIKQNIEDNNIDSTSLSVSLDIAFTMETLSPPPAKSGLSADLKESFEMLSTKIEQLQRVDDILMSNVSDDSHSMDKLMDTNILPISSLLTLEKQFEPLKSDIIPIADCIFFVLSRGLCNNPLSTLQVSRYFIVTYNLVYASYDPK